MKNSILNTIIAKLEAHIIPPSVMEDENAARLVHPLTMLAALGLILSIFYTVVWLIIMPQMAHRVAYPLFAAAVSAFTLVSIRLEGVHVARQILLNGIWLLVTAVILTSGGTRAPMYGLYIMIVMVAALLSSWRLAFIYGISSIIFGFILAIIDPSGTMLQPIASPMSAWLSQTTIMIIVTGAAYFVLQRVEQLLQQSREAFAELEKSEKALRESDARFRLISTATSDYTFSTQINAENKLEHTFLTGAFEAISGYTPEEFLEIGGWRAAVHPDDVAEDDRAMALLQKNKVAASELRIIRKDGTIRWVHVDAHPVWDSEQNRLVAINGGVKDITQQIESQDAIFGLSVNLQDKANQLSTINEIARDISSVTDLETTLNRVLDRLQTAIPFDVFFVALHNPDTQMISFPIMYDDGNYWQQEPGTIRNGGAVARVLQTGKPTLINRTAEEIEAKQTPPMRVGDVNKVSASIIIIPLPIGNEIIGVVSIQSYTINNFNENHMDFLSGAAQQIAIAVQNAQLYDSMQSEITQRKRYETAILASEKRLRLIVESLPDRIVILDRDGEYQEILKQDYAFANIGELGGVVGESLYERFSHEFAEYCVTKVRKILDTKQPELFEYDFLNDSEHFILEGRAVPLDEKSVLWLSRNITDRKRLELEIQELNADLERRVKERTLQLNIVNQELEAFAYSVSHDLRAPLRRINGFSQMLLESYKELLDETGQHYLSRIQVGTQEMGEMIDALLTLSRVTRSQLYYEFINLSLLAEEIANTLTTSNPEREVEFKIAPDLIVEGDRKLLRVMMTNILENAWKYTGKETDAKIEFGQDEIDGELTFFVRDNGIGFDMAYSKQLFSAFHRLHTSEGFSGTGIGLATIKRIVHRHHGRIWAQAAVNEGATFYFTFHTMSEADIENIEKNIISDSM